MFKRYRWFAVNHSYCRQPKTITTVTIQDKGFKYREWKRRFKIGDYAFYTEDKTTKNNGELKCLLQN